MYNDTDIRVSQCGGNKYDVHLTCLLFLTSKMMDISHESIRLSDMEILSYFNSQD